MSLVNRQDRYIVDVRRPDLLSLVSSFESYTGESWVLTYSCCDILIYRWYNNDRQVWLGICGLPFRIVNLAMTAQKKDQRILGLRASELLLNSWRKLCGNNSVGPEWIESGLSSAWITRWQSSKTITTSNTKGRRSGSNDEKEVKNG